MLHSKVSLAITLGPRDGKDTHADNHVPQSIHYFLTPFLLFILLFLFRVASSILLIFYNQQQITINLLILFTDEFSLSHLHISYTYA